MARPESSGPLCVANNIMYQGYHIGVVIPTYNEAEFVGTVLDELPPSVDRAYPVDDCSTDDTWAVIRRRAENEQPDDRAALTEPATTSADGGQVAGPEIIPIRHDENRGRGGAVKTGYLEALEDGIDVVVVMDGDGQMDPRYLESLVDPIVSGDADYAKGNRLGTTELRNQMSSWRLFGNVLLTSLTRIASGYWGMTDPQNGYTAISRDSLERIGLDTLFDGYGFLNDVLVRLNAHDARIVDVPIPAIYGDEESNIEYHSFVPFLSMLLVSRFLWRIRSKYAVPDFHPVAMVYGFAILTGVVALGTVVQSLLSVQMAVTGANLLTVVALCPLSILTAFVLERYYNRRLEFELESDLTVDDQS